MESQSNLDPKPTEQYPICSKFDGAQFFDDITGIPWVASSSQAEEFKTVIGEELVWDALSQTWRV